MKILIDNGHGVETPGKRSPDGLFFEYAYNREIASRIVVELKDCGFDVQLLVPELEDVPLRERCRRENEISSLIGPRNVLLVSIHVNAAGADGRWHNATGWSAYTTPGITPADLLAYDLYVAAEKYLVGKAVRVFNGPREPDFEQNFYILKHSKCPAVLTENFFMDNRKDIEFLQSCEGKKAITMLHVEGITEYMASL